jgi:hypothetical protein
MTKKFTRPAGTAKIPRRSFLRAVTTTATVTCIAPILPRASQILFDGQAANVTASSGSAESASADAMEQALEMMTGLAQLTNHGPMAAEALVALGRPDAVIPFVEKYKKRFKDVAPEPYQLITRDNWRAALGDGARVADWTGFFNRELKENPWPQALDRWVDALAPGLAAAAAHGLIRTGHAAHSLSIKETELRRRELAEGLGYWAAYYQLLPSTPVSPSAPADPNSKTPPAGGLSPAQALQRVPLLPDERRPRTGSIMNGLRSLDGFQPFTGVVDLIEVTGKPEQFLSEVTEAFATTYVKNVNQRSLIALIHTVTSATAIRSLLPYLSPDTARKTLRYGWQTGAALYSLYGQSSANSLPENKEIRREDLIARAVDSHEEHAIKFTEACLREHALNPKPIYLLAAQDAVRRINPW